MEFFSSLFSPWGMLFGISGCNLAFFSSLFGS
jgi:hypothetical protein